MLTENHVLKTSLWRPGASSDRLSRFAATRTQGLCIRRRLSAVGRPHGETWICAAGSPI
jgi:hypothetical protein